MNPPIGVFDSGIGGLWVLKELIALLPKHSFVYLADQKNLPYGEKSAEELLFLMEEHINFFLKKGVKQLVLACHTISCTIFPLLEKEFSIELFGMIEPSIEGLKPFKKVLLLGTKRTTSSNVYQSLLEKEAPLKTVTALACPQFVSLVEQDLENTSLIEKEVEKTLIKINEPIDAVLLACTHFSFLKSVIQNYLPAKTQIIDPARKCAEMVRSHQKNIPLKKSEMTFYTTASDKIKIKNMQKAMKLLFPEQSLAIIKPSEINSKCNL